MTSNLMVSPNQQMHFFWGIRQKLWPSKADIAKSVRQTNTNIRQLKRGVRCSWLLITGSSRKWEVAIQRPQLIIWYVAGLFSYSFCCCVCVFFSIKINIINKYFLIFQISLIDRVHKIYNDTIWQDRSVSFSLFHSQPMIILLFFFKSYISRTKMASEAWDLLSRRL